MACECAPNAHTQVAIAEVDCTKHRPLCKENQIKGLPTMKGFILGGDEAPAYSGQRTLSNLDAYVQRHLLVSAQRKTESLGGDTAAATPTKTASQNSDGTLVGIFKTLSYTHIIQYFGK